MSIYHSQNRSETLDAIVGKAFASRDWLTSGVPNLRRFLLNHECEYADEISDAALSEAIEIIRSAREYGSAEFEIVGLTTETLPSSLMARLVLDWIDQGATEISGSFQ
ncbi:MAG: hypothetical protein ACSHXY_00530 [Alphaproteobacteria bacterium]